MRKWSDPRNLTIAEKIDKAYDRVMYYTGFKNERLFKNPRKDIFKKFLGVLKDPNSVIFDYILLAWEYVPIDENMLMHMEMEQIFLKIKDKYEPKEPYVNIEPKNIRVARMRFVKNPKKVTDKYVEHALSTTINEINSNNILSQYKEINMECVNFLNNYQVNCEQVRLDKENMSLLLDDVYIIIPQLDKGLYYTINGNRRYPLYTEAWHSTKNASGETSFLYRVKAAADDEMLYEGYFAIGYSEAIKKPVYYLRHSGRIYNPLSMYDANSINDRIVPKLLKVNNPELTQILNNTIEDYNAFKNLVPNDTKIYERKDIIPRCERVKDGNIRTLRNAVISVDVLISIITGYHQKNVVYDVYGSVFNALLKAGSTEGKYKSKPGARYGTMRSEKLSTTLVKNNYLTFANMNSNPLDVFYLLGFKKALAGKKTAKTTKEKDRFIDYNTFDSIDNITNRSETTIGIVSSLLCHLSDDKLVIGDE